MEDDTRREEGIKAVIYLQAMAGFDEPREKAEAGWDGMTPSQQSTTLEVYGLMRGSR